jgi:hypothetical protein
MLDVSFQSLNLETRELIDNPDDGFLPPNTDAPNGEGFIIFSVRQKDGIAHLDADCQCKQVSYLMQTKPSCNQYTQQHY